MHWATILTFKLCPICRLKHLHDNFAPLVKVEVTLLTIFCWNWFSGRESYYLYLKFFKSQCFPSRHYVGATLCCQKCQTKLVLRREKALGRNWAPIGCFENGLFVLHWCSIAKVQEGLFKNCVEKIQFPCTFGQEFRVTSSVRTPAYLSNG